MKKLLFTLGSVTTITAPVAVAVSCGSKSEDNASKITKSSELNDKFITLGFTSPNADEIFSKVGGTSTTPIELSNSYKDTVVGTHNEGAYAFFVKGTPKAVKTDTTKGWTVDKGNSGAYFDFTVETVEPTQASKEMTSFAKSFGWTSDDYKNTSYLILLKIDKTDPSKTKTVTVFRVINEGDKYGFTSNLGDEFMTNYTLTKA